MIDRIKEKVLNMVLSREFVLILFIFLCTGALVNRLFTLQIVNGASYVENFQLTTQKERTIKATRGNIYDVNGKLLAYNELAYSVTIEDVFESGRSKNRNMNEVLYSAIKMVEAGGDDVVNDFDIILDKNGQFQYNVEGNTLLRFLADIYGRQKIEQLKNSEKNATAQEVIDYLCSSKKYGIGTYTDTEEKTDFEPEKGYSKADILKMVTIRYAMSLNTYQKYIATTIAEDVNEKTVAIISENSDVLDGINIAEDTVRRYSNSVYFSHIIGYTGKISAQKLEEYRKIDESYSLNDQIGISGIEASMEEELRGRNGSETIYVDKFGKVIESTDYVEPVAGNDVYLTIDSEMLMAAYNILEQKIAGIVVSKIQNIKEYKPGQNSGSKDIKIAIYDVYNAFIENNVISLEHFAEQDAKETEKTVYEKYLTQKEQVLERIRQELLVTSTPYKELITEYQAYMLQIVSVLTKEKVLTDEALNTGDEIYNAWKTEESISLSEYLKYCISQNYVDVTKLNMEDKYADSEEVFQVLTDYIIDKLSYDTIFEKKVYRFMIKSDIISGREICQLLCEQKLINPEESEVKKLYDGSISAYQFMMDRLMNLDVTPAMLALEPCSGSMVVTNVNTGDVIALISYPGYDNNRLANSVDADYFSKLMNDETKPMYNKATQETTAPGSTFKMVSATAALLDNVVSTGDRILCQGPFDKITPPPKCWIYPGGHGRLNISEAIKNSCNNYFYEVGYLLGSENGTYDSTLGTDRLAEYASAYGLTDLSGVEIEESMPKASDEDAVRSAIGQGNNDFTTAGLARYVTTVANSGTCYDLTLIDRIQDRNGNLLVDNSAKVRNTIPLDEASWNSIHSGMRGVVESKEYFSNLTIKAGGKTGTAEQTSSHPNHALFVGYAGYNEPEIALAVRITNGYSSDYAAQAAKDMFVYYFRQDDLENIVTGRATPSTTAVSNTD